MSRSNEASTVPSVDSGLLFMTIVPCLLLWTGLYGLLVYLTREKEGLWVAGVITVMVVAQGWRWYQRELRAMIRALDATSDHMTIMTLTTALQETQANFYYAMDHLTHDAVSHGDTEVLACLRTICTQLVSPHDGGLTRWSPDNVALLIRFMDWGLTYHYAALNPASYYEHGILTAYYQSVARFKGEPYADAVMAIIQTALAAQSPESSPKAVPAGIVKSTATARDKGECL